MSLDLMLVRLRDAADFYRQMATARHALADSSESDQHLAELDAEYVDDLAAAAETERRFRQETRRLEDELAGLEDKLRERRSREGGNAAMVLALAGEVASLRRYRDQVEQKLLDRWQDGERSAAVQAGETRAANEQRRSIADRRQGHADSAEKAGRAVPEIEADLEHLMRQLPPKISRKLQTIARRFADPIADLVEGNCGSCGQSLPLQEAVDADREAALITCQGCGRFVVARSSRRTRGGG